MNKQISLKKGYPHAHSRHSTGTIVPMGRYQNHECTIPALSPQSIRPKSAKALATHPFLARRGTKRQLAVAGQSDRLAKNVLAKFVAHTQGFPFYRRFSAMCAQCLVVNRCSQCTAK